MKLTRPALASLTGYSVRAILNMERGSTSQGKPTHPACWTRYRMACAGLAAGQQAFDWQPVAFVPLQAQSPPQP
jgi:hypothetical protein